MNFSGRIIFLISLFAFCTGTVKGQNQPIGYWQSYLPYNSALGVATNGNTLYTVGKQGFFTYNSLTNEKETYSKVEGMSDLGMQVVGYDMATSTAILVYSNGNIDLFKNNTFYNIPDLKIKTIAGTKTVYEVYTLNGLAYLSSAIGVIVINLTDHSVKETYQFTANSQTIPVKSFIGAGSYFYAVTTNGLYRANQNNPELQNFQAWDIIDSNKTYTSIKSVNNSLFLASLNSVFSLNGSTVTPIYTAPVYATPSSSGIASIHHIDAGYTSLLVSEYKDSLYAGAIKIINPVSYAVDSFTFTGNPWQAVQLLDSSIWMAEGFGGLMKRVGPNQVSYFTPPGPLDANAFDIYANNSSLWIAHGGYDDQYHQSHNTSDIANYNNGIWTYYARYIYHPFDTLADFTVLARDESNGTIYAGSYGDGLFIMNANGSYQLIRQNSIFDPSQFFFNTTTGQYGTGRLVGGIAIDHNHNVWVTTLRSAHQLYVKTADSQWYKFIVPNSTNGGQLLVDDNDQIWFVNQDATGAGLTVFNPNGTISDPSDDVSYHLTTGVGFGNLPNNQVFCIAKDQNNNIWVGTADGIGIVNSCHPSPGTTAPCDAEIPIVQYDKYAGYLFKGHSVRTIAVDGANRKWVGLDDGVWLLSADASKIVYNFTAENSPLPSNHIEKVAIDPVTGVVYIGTDMGLVSFRGTATEGGTTNDNVLTFPNPVPSGYTGTIAIKGLVANADVRITDIDGQLVYKTKALGGQAVWNGLDYTGHRPQSGVYLIFVSNTDGSATYTGKMVFLK